MGTTVLDPHIRATPNVYTYAHCLAGRPGNVAVLVINADRQRTFDINLPMAAERYTLTAHRLEDPAVELNGQTLHLTPGGDRFTTAAATGMRIRPAPEVGPGDRNRRSARR